MNTYKIENVEELALEEVIDQLVFQCGFNEEGEDVLLCFDC